MATYRITGSLRARRWLEQALTRVTPYAGPYPPLDYCVDAPTRADVTATLRDAATATYGDTTLPDGLRIDPADDADCYPLDLAELRGQAGL